MCLGLAGEHVCGDGSVRWPNRRLLARPSTPLLEMDCGSGRYVVMAYIVMAYVAMAHIVIAHTVMAHIVMA